MKSRNFSLVILFALFFSGCVVYSFYPIYTENDLFANDLLSGEWVDDDDAVWNFSHPFKGKKEQGIIDSSAYVLKLTSNNDGKIRKSEFSVHILKLGGQYFLDFYLEDYLDDDELELASFHIIPVHTFAKLTIENNQLQINWFDQEWLLKLIEENKIRIHHEQNDDIVLLTAKPLELQKFVTKYVNSENAFKNGLEAILTRK